MRRCSAAPRCASNGRKRLPIRCSCCLCQHSTPVWSSFFFTTWAGMLRQEQHNSEQRRMPRRYFNLYFQFHFQVVVYNYIDSFFAIASSIIKIYFYRTFVVCSFNNIYLGFILNSMSTQSCSLWMWFQVNHLILVSSCFSGRRDRGRIQRVVSGFRAEPVGL